MTVNFAPVDAEARRVISEELDATLFVEASAGTGKTTSLVQRVVNLVSTGATTLDRVAAITFTEAAAAELRDRVRARLERASADHELAEQQRSRCRQGITDLDQADICTLHSFAGGILRERPLEAGLPPAFETSDEIVAGIRFNERWDAWLNLHLDGDTDLAPHLALALTFALTPAHMKEIAQGFHANYGDLDGVSFDPSDCPAPSVAYQLSDAIGEMQRLCAYSMIGAGDTLYDHVQGKMGALRRLSETRAGSPVSYRVLQDVLPIRQGGGRQGDWQTDPETGGNACAVLKALLSDLDQEAAAEIQQMRNACLIPIIESLRSFAIDYADQRRAEGRAEFHDLLIWARDLLRDNLQVRDHFRRKYSHLLIDEAQDTDPIQAEIAVLLSESVSDDVPVVQRTSNWREVLPETGKLFVVGDPKQSIYRFRRADVQQMMVLQQRLEDAGGRTIKLTQNFRSQEPVVQWVNALFERWLATGDDSSTDVDNVQADYEQMSAVWQANCPGATSPTVWTLGNQAVEELTGAVRQQEADEIGTLLKQIVSEPWSVLDSEATDGPDQEIYRPARYSDICILMPTRTGLPDLERGLEDHDVPYRLESASLVFETQEIRDLLNCLKSIDNPADQVATVAALRSQAFACSDVDLALHHERGGSFDYLDDPPPAVQGPVVDGMRVLREFHGERIWESTQSLVDRFIRHRQLMEAATGHPRMREQWRRYRFMVEQAVRFTSAAGGPLAKFLEWVDDQIQGRARVSDNPVPESDEDAVRVMTIHGSKGLEFPVVVLTGINSTPSRSPDRVLFDRRQGWVEVGVGAQNNRIATSGYEELLQLDNRLSDAEQVRLMYVATTRARDHLVLSMRRPRRGGRTVADTIAGYMDGSTALWKPLELKQMVAAPVPGDSTAPYPEVDHSIQAFARWKAGRQAMMVELGRPSFVAATALSSHGGDDKPEPTEPEPWRRGRAGTSVGRAVHAVLQSIDLATGEGVEYRARAQAVAEGVPDREGEIMRLTRVAVNSAVVQRAVASRRLWREVPVAAPVGNGSLHGFIDLLFEEDDGLVVVDYKTDAVPEAGLSDTLERYRLQGGAYAAAISKITGKPVKEMVFLFLQPNREAQLPDLRAAMADAVAAAESHFAPQPG